MQINQSFIFAKSPLDYRKNFTDEYYPSRYFPWTFLGEALWADNISSLMNTSAIVT